MADLEIGEVDGANSKSLLTNGLDMRDNSSDPASLQFI